MKKLGLLAVVVAMVMALAIPTYAVTVNVGTNSSITIGGLFATDALWKGVDKNYQTFINVPSGGGQDKTMFILDVPFWSYLYVKLQVGDFGGYADIATQISREYSNLQAIPSGTATNDADFILNGRWYGTYKFGNCEFRAGKDNGWFDSDAYGVAPSSALGYSAASTTHVALIGWGWQYDGKNANIRFLQNVNKVFGYQIALVDTGTYDAQANVARLSYAQYPAVAAKLLLHFGPVSLYPAGVYQHVKWDNIPGFDDDMTAWSVGLPVRLAVGPFVVAAQLDYGKNVGGVTSGNVLMRGQNSNTGFLRNSHGGIVDTTDWNGFIDVSYKFGPAAPHVFFGWDRATNDNWKVAGNDYYQRLSYGIDLYYTIGQLQIIPELAFYDYGTLPGVASKPDLGKEWLGGVQFRFFF